MVVSAGCAHVNPAAATSSTDNRLTQSIDSPPVAQESREGKPSAVADETAMCLILRATNQVDAEVRAERFGHLCVLSGEITLATNEWYPTDLSACVSHGNLLVVSATPALNRTN